MIVRRIVGVVAAATIAATSVGVAVVAAVFAVYTLLADQVGPAAASAIIAAALALVLAVGALIMLSGRKRPQASAKAFAQPLAPSPDAGLRERIFTMARDRPVLAAGAAVAAGLVAWRNPRLVDVVTRFFSSRDQSV